MSAVEFTKWPKTPRLRRDAIITEKIDGTNAAIHIVKVPFSDVMEIALEHSGGFVYHWDQDEDGPEPTHAWLVGAQSRNRLISPAASGGTDNMGFAAWVLDNALGLIRILGEGTHFGEWWGSGIQRGYGLAAGDKRFSLFNVHRYRHVPEVEHGVPGLGLVPVLDRHTFSTDRVDLALTKLREEGSQAAPGFMRPEGVVVFHSQSGTVYKALLENDDVPKGAVS